MADIYQEPERTDETYGFVTIVERTVLPVDPRRYSTWLKLRRIQSWINRFIQNCQGKMQIEHRESYWLTS